MGSRILRRVGDAFGIDGITRDIDGDWSGEFPTMEEMENALRNAVKKVDSSLDIRANRIFGERKSAGFRIINEMGEKWEILQHIKLGLLNWAKLIIK